jgi:CRISPR system Cascade subunit CasB
MSTDSDRWEARFVAGLRALAPPADPAHWDRATLAELRRSLGKDFTYLLPRTGWLFRAVPDFALEDAALLASLFASYPEAAGHDSVGAALRRLPETESVQKRFIALVDSSREDLPGRLRQAVSLLKAKDVALGWAELLTHLRNWGHESRWVQWRWSRDFWAEARSEQAEAEVEPEPIVVPASANN